MIYKYRVTLEGIKGFYRVYLVNGSNTLYTFHKQLRSDLEFAIDQPILFKAFAGESLEGRYALIDLGQGTVDHITVAATVKGGIDKFVYFYDTKAKKYVNITFEGEATDVEDPVNSPVIIDSKGPLPIEFENGYVAFEDLPKEQRHLPGDVSFDNIEGDEDFDDDENGDGEDEDADDEDGKEIYDENE